MLYFEMFSATADAIFFRACRRLLRLLFFHFSRVCHADDALYTPQDATLRAAAMMMPFSPMLTFIAHARVVDAGVSL